MSKCEELGHSSAMLGVAKPEASSDGLAQSMAMMVEYIKMRDSYRAESVTECYSVGYIINGKCSIRDGGGWHDVPEKCAYLLQRGRHLVERSGALRASLSRLSSTLVRICLCARTCHGSRMRICVSSAPLRAASRSAARLRIWPHAVFSRYRPSSVAFVVAMAPHRIDGCMSDASPLPTISLRPPISRRRRLRHYVAFRMFRTLSAVSAATTAPPRAACDAKQREIVRDD